MKPQPAELLLSTAHRGQRLDRVLAQLISTESRARLQALLAQGAVRVDGGPAKASLRVKGTERVELRWPAPEPTSVTPEALPLARLYEDDEVVVVDKAAGMVVHPGAGHRSGTLVNALLHHVDGLSGIGGEVRPGIVHRLDKDTSGVLVIAKTDAALRALQAAFKARAVEKTYLALVLGQPDDQGSMRTLFGRHPKHRQRFTGRVAKGKEAVTHYRVTGRWADVARVEIALETGRTHQIRVHFAEAGHPLVGDALYGGKRAQRPDLIGRQALHALRLSFPHPRTGARVTCTAPLPADWKAAVRALGRGRG